MVMTATKIPSSPSTIDASYPSPQETLETQSELKKKRLREQVNNFKK